MDPWRLLPLQATGRDAGKHCIVLHIVAFRFWVRPCPFGGRGGGGEG